MKAILIDKKYDDMLTQSKYANLSEVEAGYHNLTYLLASQILKDDIPSLFFDFTYGFSYHSIIE